VEKHKKKSGGGTSRIGLFRRGLPWYVRGSGGGIVTTPAQKKGPSVIVDLNPKMGMIDVKRRAETMKEKTSHEEQPLSKKEGERRAD